MLTRRGSGWRALVNENTVHVRYLQAVYLLLLYALLSYWFARSIIHPVFLFKIVIYVAVHSHNKKNVNI
jgi:hypothetical protein